MASSLIALLDRNRSIAPPGFDRWLIPPAALAIHLSIGMAYGFSVFWLPLSQAIGIDQPRACGPDVGFWSLLTTTTCDWPVAMLGWTYTLFFVVLGSSAALLGRWLEDAGPRKAGVVAALAWSGGLAVAAYGVYLHQLWLLWLGAGVIGGLGLGLGYISPVSTLIKWFPDHRGLATGLAIMGFGGGAMIGAPLADRLMRHFAGPGEVGVWQTIAVLAVVYLVAMLLGAWGYRVPPAGWSPPGWTPPATKALQVPSLRYVPVDRAVRTPQFWLLWGVLCLNVSAGIGVVGMASPMLQEVFGGRLVGVAAPLAQLEPAVRAEVATIAAAFAGLLSLFNIAGRIGWASLSDAIGRKATYTLFFAVGILLYAYAPSAGAAGRIGLFVALFCVILTFYGGGFATIPAYLADLFGTRYVGAIHGRLLTAWSFAGVLGPVLVNYLREYQLARGLAPGAAYDMTLYLLAGLLVAGLLCNLLVRPVDARHFTAEVPAPAADGRPAGDSPEPGGALARDRPAVGATAAGRGNTWPLALTWLGVGLPLAWGVWTTLTKAAALFR